MSNIDDLTDSSKRIKPRYQLALKAEVWVRGLEHHTVERTANISTTGLFLCTTVNVPVGDTIHIRVIFKDLDAYFDAKAQVIWRCDGTEAHPVGLGLKFADVNHAQQNIIERYLKNYINIREK